MTDNETPNPSSHPGRWASGVVVIAMGMLFLFVNLGYHLPFLGYDNWWAWFILIGAAWPLAEAWERYRQVGKLDGVAAHSLLNALAVVLVAAIFILGLSWATWWPLFVVYGGLCMLLPDTQRWRRRRAR